MQHSRSCTHWLLIFTWTLRTRVLENRHEAELHLLPIEDQVPWIPALHACTRCEPSWACRFHGCIELLDSKMEHGRHCTMCIDAYHSLFDVCKHACKRIEDGCSCHSMRNTIEDLWMFFDQDQESARSTAYRAAGLLCASTHSLELDTLDRSLCLDRESLTFVLRSPMSLHGTAFSFGSARLLDSLGHCLILLEAPLVVDHF